MTLEIEPSLAVENDTVPRSLPEYVLPASPLICVRVALVSTYPKLVPVNVPPSLVKDTSSANAAKGNVIARTTSKSIFFFMFLNRPPELLSYRPFSMVREDCHGKTTRMEVFVHSGSIGAFDVPNSAPFNSLLIKHMRLSCNAMREDCAKCCARGRRNPRE
jgi:hypothetical protein